MIKDHSKIPVIQLSIEFSVKLIKYAEQLEVNNKHVIANEVLKSGTSIGAFVMEGQSVNNNAEYFEKIRMADRQAHKAWYWLYLCEQMAESDLNKELAKKLEEIMHQLHNILILEDKKQVA